MDTADHHKVISGWDWGTSVSTHLHTCLVLHTANWEFTVSVSNQGSCQFEMTLWDPQSRKQSSKSEIKKKKIPLGASTKGDGYA